MMKHLDLFSGIGGFALAARWIGGIETVAFCENDEFCRKVLAKNFKGVKIYDDVREFHATLIPGPVDLITAGFPCQDVSVAGQGKGLHASRSGLFFEICRISDELSAGGGVRPILLLENVPGLLSGAGGGWAREVFSELARRGYCVEWKTLGASDVGAPHRRKRWWAIAYPPRANSDSERHLHGEPLFFSNEGRIPSLGHTPAVCKDVADSDSIRCGGGDIEGCRAQERIVLEEEQEGREMGSEASRCCSDVADPDSGRELQPKGSIQNERGWIGDSGEALADPDLIDVERDGPTWVEESAPRRPAPQPEGGFSTVREWGDWSVEPDVGRVANGVPQRVDRLRALGNAVVPQVAMIPLQRAKEIFYLAGGISDPL